MVVRARSRARKSSRDAGERSGRSGTRERERERKGKDVSAAPSYPALIELLPPFYRARNKPYTYAPSLVNKPRPHELIIPKILQTVNNFPDIRRISVQKFPESLSLSLSRSRKKRKRGTCEQLIPPPSYPSVFRDKPRSCKAADPRRGGGEGRSERKKWSEKASETLPGQRRELRSTDGPANPLDGP